MIVGRMIYLDGGRKGLIRAGDEGINGVLCGLVVVCVQIAGRGVSLSRIRLRPGVGRSQKRQRIGLD